MSSYQIERNDSVSSSLGIKIPTVAWGTVWIGSDDHSLCIKKQVGSNPMAQSVTESEEEEEDSSGATSDSESEDSSHDPSQNPSPVPSSHHSTEKTLVVQLDFRKKYLDSNEQCVWLSALQPEHALELRVTLVPLSMCSELTETLTDQEPTVIQTPSRTSLLQRQASLMMSGKWNRYARGIQQLCVDIPFIRLPNDILHSVPLSSSAMGRMPLRQQIVINYLLYFSYAFRNPAVIVPTLSALIKAMEAVGSPIGQKVMDMKWAMDSPQRHIQQIPRAGYGVTNRKWTIEAPPEASPMKETIHEEGGAKAVSVQSSSWKMRFVGMDDSDDSGAENPVVEVEDDNNSLAADESLDEEYAPLRENAPVRPSTATKRIVVTAPVIDFDAKAIFIQVLLLTVSHEAY